MKPVSFGVVGVGGYASVHLNTVEALEKEGLGKLSAVVVRNQEKYAGIVASLKNKGVTVYDSYHDMLEKESGIIDIITLPTAVHQHKDMTIEALKKGFSVIVEKPPAVTIQDIDEMIEAEKRSAGFCTVGFQLLSKNVVRALKKCICEGKLGRIREVAVKGIWKRLDSYYERNNWAGKFICDGKYVLDGTLSNPLSHFLMNELYFASMDRGKAAIPVKVRAELYRGHKIEGEDTSCLEAETENGVRVFFFATLCGPANEQPVYDVTGEKGVARWTVEEDIRIEYYDGKVEFIKDDGSDEKFEVFRNAVRYLRGIDRELHCPLPLTRPFVLALNGAYESAKKIKDIPKEHMTIGVEGGSVSTTINGIKGIIDEAFTQRKLYSDLGVE